MISDPNSVGGCLVAVEPAGGDNPPEAPRHLSATPGTPQCAAFDRLESKLAEYPQVDMPVTHRFTPGLYIREIFMPALPGGTIVTSRIHLFEHPFVISKGKVMVWTEGEGNQLLVAPYTGVTKPHTRRILHVLEDTIWTTFHVTNETDPDVIVKQVTMDHSEHLEKLIDTSKNTMSSQIFINGGAS